MENKPLISVIIPVYNAELTIFETLKSLENQHFKDFEAVLIDDGSTDNTKAVISEIIKLNKINISYFYQNNAGVSVARNTGLTQSKGKYICFLDADDIYSPLFLEQLMCAVKKSNADTAYCSHTRKMKELDHVEHREIQELDHMELMENFMLRKIPTSFFCYIYKKQIISKNKLRFTENVKYGEDNEFVWKYLSHCKKGIVVNKKLYFYRDNPNSAMNSISWEMTDTIENNIRVKEYLNEKEDPFYNDYDTYMTGRILWSLSRTYAFNNNKSLYNRLNVTYDVREAMVKMVRGNQFLLVKISAIIYLLSPKLFYTTISSVGRLSRSIKKK